MTWHLDLGANPAGEKAVRFRVWAPYATHVEVCLIDRGRAFVELQKEALGYFQATIPDVLPGAHYRYVLDGDKERPDPAARHQPEGVHGPSQVVNPSAFHWSDQHWRGIPLRDFIIYELHPGTFSRAGTFEGIIPFLDYLQSEVGVTAVELMPVTEFPGVRNWGYDGTYPFAPHHSYGGPDGLKTLVNACHARGIAVVLDVVYNHLGPEGNYLGDFGPYFTDRYRTPWGQAVNFDGPDSDEVRHYFVSNALYWIVEYHIDALRLDAIHGIYDFSATHVLHEIAASIHEVSGGQGRPAYVMAESDLNDARVITPSSLGGYGLDAQWNDDFHHAIHTVLTRERGGYYQDFGQFPQLTTALEEGFVYSGQRSAYRRRRHGNSSRGRRSDQFVIYAQNHDQVGNRAMGDRLSTLVPQEALKASAAAVLLPPAIPLLFMGEEYGETAPFQYFVDHGDPALIEAVKKGRHEEFSAFGWQEIPEPDDPATFERSRVHPGKPSDEQQAGLLRWYRTLIDLRKSIPALRLSSLRDDEDPREWMRLWTYAAEQIVAMHRWASVEPAVLVFIGFNAQATPLTIQAPAGSWRLQLDSTRAEFGGIGTEEAPAELTVSPQGTVLDVPPYAVRLYVQEGLRNSTPRGGSVRESE